MLTTTQLATLKADILASTDPAIVAARDAVTGRNDTLLAQLYNSAASPVRKAWRVSVSGRDLFDAMTIGKFDNLTAGKRDAYRLMIDMGSIDATRQKMRKAIDDIWGVDATPILQDMQENATRLEVLLGGGSATTATVEGLKRSYVGTVTQDEIGMAFK